jgi:hypothetical protein
VITRVASAKPWPFVCNEIFPQLVPDVFVPRGAKWRMMLKRDCSAQCVVGAVWCRTVVFTQGIDSQVHAALTRRTFETLQPPGPRMSGLTGPGKTTWWANLFMRYERALYTRRDEKDCWGSQTLAVH